MPRLVGAFALLGFAIALTVRADLGLAPWDVLHQGISERTGVPMGTVGIVVGLVVLLAWIPLKERASIGTLLNIVLIGVAIDVSLAVLPDVHGLALRWAALLVGAALIGPAIALYLSCELGAGPRDGIMTALTRGGRSVRVIRTVMELTVLAAGALLGGTVGLGTVLIALSLGPNIHLCMERFRLEPLEAAPA